jgi:hypothetical protein
MLPALSLLIALSAPSDAPPDEFFEREVRPLLVERCQACHGGEKTKAGLKLTSRESILKGGDSGPAALEGNPEESLLIQAIHYRDEPRMPPQGKLTDAEIATLTKWVRMGLPWPETKIQTTAAAPTSTFTITDEQRQFWAFQPVRGANPPAVKDESWPRDAIDRFILARLEAEGLKPAPEADRRTLIRRVTFDLTGLPPTPEEVEAFLNDDSPEAYAKVVDRLLASPQYGVRWARHWLDVVRYADSLDSRGSGQPGDILDAWRYRDWVVDALNNDMPYDRFVQEQIAGDVLPPRSESEGTEGFNRAGTIATTMLAIGNWGNGDADKEKILTDIADDQVDVVSKAFLGLTVSCARCHDHKFDPISQKDYYALAGIFFSTHILPKLTPKGAGETIIRVPLESPAAMKRRQEHAERLAALEKQARDEARNQAIAYAKTLKPQAPRYLLALWDYLQRPADQASQSLDDFARSRGLLPFALRQWSAYLGTGGDYRLIDRKVDNIGGVPGVLAWNGAADFASVTFNTTAEARKILTFTLPPKSFNVHPGPASGVAVSWTSPMSGTVRITGRIADADPAGGDGVSWFLDVRSIAGRRELASGDLANGGAMAFGQGKGADALASVAVRPGDRILLGVLPKAEYTCDTTTLDLVVSDLDGPSSWDLTRDVLADFHAGNPHADRLGHADVWRFEDMRTKTRPASVGDDPNSALARWSEAASRGDRQALERAAEAFAADPVLDGEQSPFAVRDPADEAVLPAESREAIARARAELDAHRRATPPPVEYANAAQEGGVPESPHAGVHDVNIHIRGRYDRLGERVPRRFPTILGGDRVPPITEGSGRKELAAWLTRAENPLPARVIVNRLWQHHFGQGIVRTPSNFGKLGDRPSHPELLDHLASRLVAEGWSLKAIHRAILLSSTYRQSSVPEPATLSADPDNRLFGRMNRRRLEAEAIRDALLAAAGTLDATPGGPAERDFNQPRRGLYVITIRSDRATFGALFDQADSTAPVDQRVVSTVAPQALFLLNNPFVLAQAKALAGRLLALPGDDPSRIQRAYALLFARPPTREEIEIGLEALAASEPAEAAWEAYAQILLCSNEFLYVD